jgi:hypothetical protein
MRPDLVPSRENDEGRLLRAVFLEWHCRISEALPASIPIDPDRVHFRAAWKNACKAAGCPGALVHDMRRSAVRTFERAGVPRSVAMSLVGHKTESIYRRYAIVDEAMQREAAARLDAWIAAPPAAASTATLTALRRGHRIAGVRDRNLTVPARATPP